MTPDVATDLAARIFAVLHPDNPDESVIADRERVASDLAGVRDHQRDTPGYCAHSHGVEGCPDARRYADGLRRTAALYGII